MLKNSLIILILFFSSCDLDEEPPLIPENLRGYFTMSESNPRIHLSWSHPLDDDIKEYHIFRSTDNGLSFDSLGFVSYPINSYKDTSIIWLEDFGYKIKAKDKSTNIGDFSDSVFINCFKPGGFWKLTNFDSIYLCLDPFTYQTQEMFQLTPLINLETLNDTLKIMDFPGIQLDTINWSGNGWMYLTYSVLELSTDSVNYDTVTYANTAAPEYYTMILRDPESGSITFNSNSYDPIEIHHSLKGCDGEDLFP